MRARSSEAADGPSHCEYWRHAVREALRRLGLADTAVENSRLGMQSHWDGYGENRKFVEYRCTSSFAIETRDLEQIQQLLVDVVAAGAHHVESVEFDVRAKPEQRAEARRDAVEAARRKLSCTPTRPVSNSAPLFTSRTSTPNDCGKSSADTDTGR